MSDTIQSLADKVGKVFKSDVQNMLEEIFNNTDDKQLRLKLAQAYKFFMPSKTTKVKTPEQWVLKAVEKKGCREYLQSPYQDGGEFIGLDGYRVHYMSRPDFETGYYFNNKTSVLDSEKTEAFTFPQWKKTIPTERSLSSVININDLEVRKEGAYIVYVVKHDDTETLIQKKYLDDFLSGEEEFTILHHSYGSGPLHLQCKWGKGIIYYVKKYK